jgi:hypothetical protein
MVDDETMDEGGGGSLLICKKKWKPSNGFCQRDVLDYTMAVLTTSVIFPQRFCTYNSTLPGPVSSTYESMTPKSEQLVVFLS